MTSERETQISHTSKTDKSPQTELFFLLYTCCSAIFKKTFSANCIVLALILARDQSCLHRYSFEIDVFSKRCIFLLHFFPDAIYRLVLFFLYPTDLLF